MYIQWSDRDVRGSPFKVNVASKSDASRVAFSGEGLSTAVMGQEIKATIDTRRAGPGLSFISLLAFESEIVSIEQLCFVCYSAFHSKLNDHLNVSIVGVPGELTAHCMGPTREAYCSLYNNHDGTFTLTIKPQEPGHHLLQVKYNDDHIPGKRCLNTLHSCTQCLLNAIVARNMGNILCRSD